MAIEWSNSLSTGLLWQDTQHKELFRRINNLLEAMNVGRGKEEVMKLFQFLDDYFVVHFEAEEQAMGKFNYPQMVSHLAEHTRFIEDISKLSAECGKNMTTGLVIKVQRQVVDWLINHIGGIDKELGKFLASAESERKGKG
ncbi:MAG: hemerythrin family protein [Deltaproteobacteria bacterium]|nr:hemerythrin family protein [Deltaproteobacteria bacterium]